MGVHVPRLERTAVAESLASLDGAAAVNFALGPHTPQVDEETLDAEVDLVLMHPMPRD